MKTLSLCLIVKDEEKNLATCLESVKDCVDEIIVVDTGSTDKTVEIAKHFTDKVYFFEWVYDFSKARNFSFDRATSDYIMWLDGDDLVLEDSVEKIKELKASEQDFDVVMCSYVTAYTKNFEPTFKFMRERIVKNSPLFRFQDPIHEVISLQGKVIYREDISVYHNRKDKPHTDRNLNIYRRMLSSGKTFTPRQQFYYARELYYNNLIDEAIHTFAVFLSQGKGWSENNIEACLNLSKCYQLKKEKNNALTALFGSFVYDLPRGEVLFEIGKIFEESGEYKKAIYWYEQALQAKPNVAGGGFVNLDCYQFLPALELCVCYYRLGDKKRSKFYHKLSKKFKPDNASVLYNENFFNNLKE